jgi:hypothetical protein
VVALGEQVAGLMSNNARLQERIRTAAEAAGEPVWPLPLPEDYKELIPDEPVDVKLKGEAALEVTEVKADGAARLEGRITMLNASGVFLLSDIEFDYDRARDEEKPMDGDRDDSPGFLGVNPNLALRAVAMEPIKVEVDPRGKITITSKGAAKGYSARVLDFGGLNGILPEAKVGPGDTWKSDDALAIPNLPFNLKIEAATTFDKKADINGVSCALLKSTFTAKSEGDKDPVGESKLTVDGTIEGKGEGTTYFSLAKGRPLKLEAKLNLKAALKLNNPAGGDDIEMKCKIELSQGSELKKP